VAEGVVDLLEVVEVDEDQGEPVIGRGEQALLAVLEEVAPVSESRELVRDGPTASVEERPDSMPRGRCGCQIANAMHETPAVHQRYSEVPSSYVPAVMRSA
jgi:hypothetical protein